MLYQPRYIPSSWHGFLPKAAPASVSWAEGSVSHKRPIYSLSSSRWELRTVWSSGRECFVHSGSISQWDLRGMGQVLSWLVATPVLREMCCPFRPCRLLHDDTHQWPPHCWLPEPGQRGEAYAVQDQQCLPPPGPLWLGTAQRHLCHGEEQVPCAQPPTPTKPERKAPDPQRGQALLVALG